ncbi:MutS2 protein [Tepidanaerobacter acetatoxydans Re1]|uniref:Endonuclease MutS2 n=1 Tax=Tepidanaerobacter acetatoxydans (strain DSM 21804 / JCM 16047 / Re1) TaxID=1209989 RepID=F4LW92_TEPAE|nr:endonuclease MutS2 [Tepidanaerobacter acetatoxydans]AEE90868.1 MutS2 protein [Tepidanaerobacter acetatoxydans Re1]CDI40470.1 MutS2 protein [Tepidanaerobacter acetatoxydans Re1]
MNNKVETILEYDKIKSILMEYAVSSLAKEKIARMRPSSDEDLVKMLQRETSEGLALLNSGIKISLRGIKDIRNSLNLAKLGSVLSPGELLDIASTMRAARLIKSAWNEKKPADSVIINEIVNGLHIFQSLEEKIEKAIVSDEEIADNASPKLSSIRRQKKNLAQSIRNKLNEIISSPYYQKALQDPIVTVRQDRYVVPVKQEFRGSIQGVIHDQSASGATLYIEPMAVMQMNNELRQLEIEEKKEIERILWDFSKKVQENYDFIHDTLYGLAHLDFIMAKAGYSLDIKGTEPIFNNRGYINIIQGRHPLLKGEVVPLDVYLGDEFNILIITGPNTGGKTVALKTVGLFILMAQSGLHLPAQEGTEVSIFEDVFADIGDEQSIEQSLSTFSSHMKNIKEILDLATKDSLIILDELGAGTDPTEGAALAMAILNYLYEKGSRVLATTHYSELKTFAFSKEGVENASMEFDIQTLSPTYRLTIGIPGKSNAFEIAKRLGLKQEVVDLGKSLMAEESLKLEDLLTHIELQKNKAEEEREELRALKTEYLKKIDRLEEEQQKLRIQQEKIVEKAKMKARLLLDNIEREAAQIIESLKDAETENQIHIRNKAVEQARSWLRKTDEKLQDSKNALIINAAKKYKKPLKPGLKVKIAGLNQEGYILSLDEALKSAQVQVGIMKVNVPAESLIPIEQIEFEEEKSRYSSIAMSKAKEISTEIDLRGLTVDEALAEVDNYLDDAMMAGVARVTLIHGKGTGALRQGITDMLKTRSDIKAFRLGNMEEGGSGVTVVEL